MHLVWSVSFLDSVVKDQKCFAADSLVTLANGQSKPIAHLASGDTILAYDDASKLIINTPVLTMLDFQPHRFGTHYPLSLSLSSLFLILLSSSLQTHHHGHRSTALPHLLPSLTDTSPRIRHGQRCAHRHELVRLERGWCTDQRRGVECEWCGETRIHGSSDPRRHVDCEQCSGFLLCDDQKPSGSSWCSGTDAMVVQSIWTGKGVEWECGSALVSADVVWNGDISHALNYSCLIKKRMIWKEDTSDARLFYRNLDECKLFTRFSLSFKINRAQKKDLINRLATLMIKETPPPVMWKCSSRSFISVSLS